MSYSRKITHYKASLTNNSFNPVFRVNVPTETRAAGHFTFAIEASNPAGAQQILKGAGTYVAIQNGAVLGDMNANTDLVEVNANTLILDDVQADVGASYVDYEFKPSTTLASVDQLDITITIYQDTLSDVDLL